MKNITTALDRAAHIATKGSMELYLQDDSYLLLVRGVKTIDPEFNEVTEDKVYLLDKAEADFWRYKHTPELMPRDTTSAKPLQVRLPKYLDAALRAQCVVQATTLNKKIVSILAQWYDKASEDPPQTTRV